MNPKVQLIPINEIRILNPRYRNQQKFAVVIESIKTVGLKKPIRVSHRLTGEDGDRKYDLVCGQGRIEAFTKLGWDKIPAIVEDISKEDRLLMSLVENMARRFGRPMDLIDEVLRLKAERYSNVQIAQKLGVTDVMVGGLYALSTAGEERLLEAALMGKVPLGVAMEIAKSDSIEIQRGLLKAYESKELNGFSIRAVKRLIEKRQAFGKQRRRIGAPQQSKQTSAENMVKTYQKEVNKQRVMIKKNKVCETRLVFLKSALKRLLDNPDFRTLLKAEGLMTMPKFLHDQL